MNPFDHPAFMPHGHCYYWEPWLLSLHTFSDLLIGIAYYAIPLALASFVRQRKDLQFKGIFWLFSAFIFACGTTHWISILTTWKPYYWLEGSVKFFTAILSVATCIVLWSLIPRALRLPSPEELERANVELFTLNNSLEQRIEERTRELALRTREAEAANAAKDRFLSSVSHELRTPLHAIIGYSELLYDEQDELSAEQQRNDLTKILYAAQHLLSIINSVLDVAKMNAGKLSAVAESIILAPFLEDVLGLVQPLAQKNKNKTHFINETPLDFSFHSDRRGVQQVLVNLLANAHKFTHEGSVTLRALVVEQSLCFSVEDTGIGIANENLDQIFEAFYQVDNSYSREYDGTGLGLSLVKYMMGLLKGRIEVESEPLKGSRFRAYFPL
jgi:signal transduction histidine kinase